MILGRAWMHRYRAIPSSYHQYVKAKLGKRTVTINASEKPFEVEKAYYSDVVFFTELSTDETPRTGKIAGVKLPKWEGIRDAKTALESSGQKKSSKSTSPLPKIVKRYSDVFAWIYEEMPGLDPSLVTYHLDTFSNSKPIKQHAQKYHLDLEAKIKVEVEKLQRAKFIEPIQTRKCGAGITLTSHEGEKFHLSYNLDFKCSNNEAEYEALILGLIAAQKKGLRKLKIWGDSKLVVKQTMGDFALKEPLLAPYRIVVQRLLTQFDNVQIQHTPRTHNRFPDALATLEAKVDIPDDSIAIVIKKITTPAVLAEEHTE
ncbi:uncharacterized protein LOC114318721 [Camellia sinensis]|uniref:uncharacterized protein LOC114318721 n=1 Tax=Camellia sinensis TaxID=4442 RepID=UPI00103568CD|nr:uncharacterized protein LOC114318721 [Camellia sinensis]